jgi:outer membrane protein
MKYLVLFLFITFTTIVGTKLSAETKIIAILDLDRVVNQSTAGKKMISELENLHKKKLEDFKKIEENLKSEETKIVSKKNILSKEEYQKEINILREKVKKYRIQSKNLNDNLTNKRLSASKKLLQLINPILLEFSKSNSIDIILHKKTIILGKSDKDITNKILELVNKKIKKINLE